LGHSAASAPALDGDPETSLAVLNEAPADQLRSILVDALVPDLLVR